MLEHDTRTLQYDTLRQLQGRQVRVYFSGDLSHAIAAELGAYEAFQASAAWNAPAQARAELLEALVRLNRARAAYLAAALAAYQARHAALVAANTVYEAALAAAAERAAS